MAQDSTAFSHEGKFWISWGYNRAAYANSDIHFKGEGFDFTIYNVRAQDVPEQWDPAVYLNPKALTIPQFNFRAGWFINEKLSFSAGWDHMKYRISRYQRVRISGTIDALASPDYSGRYSDGALIEIDTPFIRYEHTDGFNFLRFGAELCSPCGDLSLTKFSCVLLGGLTQACCYLGPTPTFSGGVSVTKYTSPDLE